MANGSHVYKSLSIYLQRLLPLRAARRLRGFGYLEFHLVPAIGEARLCHLDHLLEGERALRKVVAVTGSALVYRAIPEAQRRPAFHVMQGRYALWQLRPFVVRPWILLRTTRLKSTVDVGLAAIAHLVPGERPPFLLG